jgi:hypothetical protein
MGKVWGAKGAALALVTSFAGSVLGQNAREPSAAPSSGQFEVGLHARSMQASARAEQAAWLTLTLPLEKLALPNAASPPSVPPPPPPAAPDKASAAPPSEPSPVSFQQLRALSDFSRRASAAALAVVQTAAERRRLDALSSRARYSALLPELRLRALRNSDQALRWIPTTDDPYRITQADGTGLILEASATFRLDRLLFAHEELQVERLRLEAGADRLKLEARVLQAVLGLFRARSLACADGGNDPERASHTLKVLELFAELDGLTAGWFSSQAPSLGRAVWGFPEAVLAECTAPARPSPAGPTKAVASLEDSE